MNTILVVLTIFLTLIFLLLLLLLFIPISYRFLIGYNQYFYFKAGIKGEGLYGLDINHRKDSTIFCPSFMGLSFNLPGKKEEKKKHNTSQNQKNSKKTFPKFGNLLENSDFFKAAINTGITIIDIIRPRMLVITGKFDMTDPYNTGVLLGTLAILDSLNKSFSINATPLWDEEYFEGEIYITGKFILGIILVRIIKLVLSKPGRKYWGSLRKKKKTEKLCNLST